MNNDTIFIGPCKCGGYGQVLNAEAEKEAGVCHFDLYGDQRWQQAPTEETLQTILGDALAGKLDKSDEAGVPGLDRLFTNNSHILKAKAKTYIDANVWDGEDRSGAVSDYAQFSPDDLEELINDLIDSFYT